MRHKEYLDPKDSTSYPWYAAWALKAGEATRQAQDAYDNDRGNEYEFDSDIWGEVKIYLFEYFDGKCAYCESIVRDISSGDVEHYAPKSKVSERVDHTGYYWLAYDLRNLLPSCEKCNRAGGKMNQFPVISQPVATKHKKMFRNNWPSRYKDMFKDDWPLLLHPYFDKDIEKHFAFTPPDIERNHFFGTIVGLTDRGRETIRICNLNREALTEERRKHQQAYLREMQTSTFTNTLDQVLLEAQEGKTEHSAALLAVATAFGEYVRKAIFGAASTAGKT